MQQGWSTSDELIISQPHVGYHSTILDYMHVYIACWLNIVAVVTA